MSFDRFKEPSQFVYFDPFMKKTKNNKGIRVEKKSMYCKGSLNAYIMEKGKKTAAIDMK